MSCDLLVIAPHPDDAEIHFGATIAKHCRLGAQVVVADASRGEMGSRGDAATRANEAMAAATTLGLHARDNLDLPDGYLTADHAARSRLIACIRRWRPALVIGPDPQALHPDHRALARLVLDSMKAAELHRMPADGQTACRGQRLLCYEGELPVLPQVVMACEEDDLQRKLAAIRCYGSQLHKPGSSEPVTSISMSGFVTWIESRGRVWGHQVDSAYGEALTAPLMPVRVDDLRHVSGRR
ncbi:MAG: bacillithiol biosynthesis deacetylase BshB1 [Planctomycetota bacterium]